jgi:hypothetical protein
MRAAMEQLSLQELRIVFPGSKQIRLAENIFAVGLDALLSGG